MSTGTTSRILSSHRIRSPLWSSNWRLRLYGTGWREKRLIALCFRRRWVSSSSGIRRSSCSPSTTSYRPCAAPSPLYAPTHPPLCGPNLPRVQQSPQPEIRALRHFMSHLRESKHGRRSKSPPQRYRTLQSHHPGRKRQRHRKSHRGRARSCWGP